MEYEVKNHILKRQIEEKSISHAYLLEGENSDEIMDDAVAFAYNILTENGVDKLSAHKFTSGTLADYMVIEPEKNNISIEKIRDMIEYFQNLPLESKYKLVIIKNCEYLRKESANALLKTLEEPPNYAIILLTCSSKDRVLKTISSRCQTISYFKDRKIDDEFDMDTLVKILYKSMKKDLLQLVDSRDFFESNKEDKETMFDNIAWFYRDMLIYKITGSIENLNFPAYEKIYSQFTHVDMRSIEKTIEKIGQVKDNFKVNANYQLSMEELLLFIMEENYD